MRPEGVKMSRTDHHAPRWVRERVEPDYTLRYYDSPPAWYVNHRWSAPDRLATRVACDRARAEFRATGQVDTIPPVDQHRHGALWDWW